MIKLCVEEYCHRCPKFEAEVDTTPFDEENFIITCKNSELCNLIKEYLESKEEV